jgi:predicted GNAT family acetyltransferase
MGSMHVIRADERSQYELYDGDELLSFAPFSQADGVVTVPHVETRLQHRGNGFSSALMDGVVGDLRANGLRIRPICWVARRHVRALPDADHLIVD